jgi:hypothetical protein
MDCPYLTGKCMLACSANKQVYIPSVSELEDYCRSASYPGCPLFSLSRMPVNVIDNKLAENAAFRTGR